MTGSEVVEFSNVTEGHAAPVAIVAVNWIGFFVLFGSSVILCYKLMTFKGPAEQPVDYFFGYREAKMLPVYVNLFAAVAYWLKVSSHANGDVGLVHDLEALKYAEYIFTCPILVAPIQFGSCLRLPSDVGSTFSQTIDLLWTLNLPYKFTFGANILVCIVCAVFSSLFPAPARYMWFVFGSILFGVTWTAIVTLVRRRLDQFYSSHIYSKNIRKETKSMLRTALFAYFSLWVAYPLLWILLEINLINHIVSHCLHVLLDVSAKSAYGFAMLRFQLSSERREFLLDDLTNSDLTKALESVTAKQLSVDDDDCDKDNDMMDYAVVKSNRTMSPRIGARRSSTQLPRSIAATPKATRLLSPLMSPMRAPSGASGYIEPFGSDRRGGGRPETPEGSPRVRRMSMEPRSYSAGGGRRRTMEGDGGDAMQAMQAAQASQQASTMQQLASLNDQLTRLLQQQAGLTVGMGHNQSTVGGGRFGSPGAGDDVSVGGGSQLRWGGGGMEASAIHMSHRPGSGVGGEIGFS